MRAYDVLRLQRWMSRTMLSSLIYDVLSARTSSLNRPPPVFR